jgi:hypothetical protein
MKILEISLALFSLVALLSCNNKKREDVSFNDSTQISNNTHVNSVLVHAIVKSMPPPVELTSLISESGASFDKSQLNPVTNKNKYSSLNEKSLALGVYAADLGYINFFEKTYESFEYIEVVKDMSDQLSVGQFIDFTTLKRLARNKSSIDSIIYITTDNFEKMNVYLAKQSRGKVSALILVGGWIESIYLVCKTGKLHNSRHLIENVGEQKVVLDEIIILLGLFKDNPDFADLIKHFSELKPLFEKVKINYEYREPTTNEVEGTLVIEDNSKRDVEISDKQFDLISQKVTELRNYVVK